MWSGLPGIIGNMFQQQRRANNQSGKLGYGMAHKHAMQRQTLSKQLGNMPYFGAQAQNAVKQNRGGKGFIASRAAGVYTGAQANAIRMAQQYRPTSRFRQGRQGGIGAMISGMQNRQPRQLTPSQRTFLARQKAGGRGPYKARPKTLSQQMPDIRRSPATFNIGWANRPTTF